MKSLKMLVAGLPVAALVMVAGNAHAAGSCDGAAGTCTGKILDIALHQDAGAGPAPLIIAEVRIEAPTSGPPTPGCTLTTGHWRVATGSEGILKGLLAAYLAGKPVIVRQVDSNACFVRWAQF